MVQLEDVSYSSNGKEIVSCLNLCLKRGMTYAIVGPSGSGKTTVLMLINGLISPTRGKVIFEGNPIDELDMPTYRSKIPLMFQEPLLIPGNGKQNIMLPFSLESNKERRPDDATIRSKLEECGLDESYLGKEISTFSGGEKQRLSLVRTLLLESKVILLDEPTSALDSRSEREVVKVISKVGQGNLMVYVTHSYQLIEAADEIIVIKDGKITIVTDKMDRSKIDSILELR